MRRFTLCLSLLLAVTVLSACYHQPPVPLIAASGVGDAVQSAASLTLGNNLLLGQVDLDSAPVPAASCDDLASVDSDKPW